MGIGGSLHKSDSWSGQWARTQRWHRRMKKAAMGEDEDQFFDYAYAFFQNCFQMRDWLKHSGKVPVSQLNTFMGGHLELKLCRDICNGSKHFTITDPSVDADFSLAREYVPRGWPGEQRRGHILFHEVTKTGQKTSKSLQGMNLAELADRCVKLWQGFLEDNQLS